MVKVVKIAENSKYKVDQEVLVEKGRLVELIIDGEMADNYYYVNEEFIKGYVSL